MSDRPVPPPRTQVPPARPSEPPQVKPRQRHMSGNSSSPNVTSSEVQGSQLYAQSGSNVSTAGYSRPPPPRKPEMAPSMQMQGVPGAKKMPLQPVGPPGAVSASGHRQPPVPAPRKPYSPPTLRRSGNQVNNSHGAQPISYATAASGSWHNSTGGGNFDTAGPAPSGPAPAPPVGANTASGDASLLISIPTTSLVEAQKNAGITPVADKEAKGFTTVFSKISNAVQGLFPVHIGRYIYVDRFPRA